MAFLQKLWAPPGDLMERHAQPVLQWPDQPLPVPPLFIFAVAGTAQKLLEKHLAGRQHGQHRQRSVGFGHGLHRWIVGVVLEAPRVGTHDVVVDDEPLRAALGAKNARDALAAKLVAARAQPRL